MKKRVRVHAFLPFMIRSDLIQRRDFSTNAKYASGIGDILPIRCDAGSQDCQCHDLFGIVLPMGTVWD